MLTATVAIAEPYLLTGAALQLVLSDMKAKIAAEGSSIGAWDALLLDLSAVPAVRAAAA